MTGRLIGAAEAVASGASTGGPIAQFKNVSKSFRRGDGRDLPVVTGINLDIAKGAIVTILGPSGCGKSTLLNMLAGIFPPTTGEVLYHGRNQAGLNHQTGYMTQNDHLLPWRTVAGNVRAPLEIRNFSKRDANDRVGALLKTVGLADFGSSYPTQVSGGMRKRAALDHLADATDSFVVERNG